MEAAFPLACCFHGLDFLHSAQRGVMPRRVDGATRVSLALLSRLFDWRDALVVVRPETLIRWHRAGWRLFWRLKSRPGRPPIPLELRRLIRRMATENPIWGEERIANELLLKLGLRVSSRSSPVISSWRSRRHSGCSTCSSSSSTAAADLCASPLRRTRVRHGPYRSYGRSLDSTVPTGT
jgi:hypothetical protein